jgi:hypothetical protein
VSPLGWGPIAPRGKDQIVLGFDAVPPYRGSYWYWLSLANTNTPRGIARYQPTCDFSYIPLEDAGIIH